MRTIGLVCPILASVVVFTFADHARADAGLPAPSLDLTFVFNNLDDYPKYDFYLKYERRFGGNRTNLDKIKAGEPIHLGGRRSGFTQVFLIALPRGQEMVMPKDFKEGWLGTAPVGGFQSQPLPGDGHGAPLGDYNGYDITYRVRIEGDRLEVAWVESNLNEWWSNARLIAILIGAACVLVPAGIIVLIVVLIMRSSRRPAE